MSQYALFPSQYTLTALYNRAHDTMRNVDGLQPQEAFDELLKFLFFKQANEQLGPDLPPPRPADESPGEGGERLAASVRSLFATYVASFNSWFRELWKDERFHLSDTTLSTLCQLFDNIHFGSISFDVRSAALREFLSPEMRRGLGIYLTPDDVVRMIVDVVGPSGEQRVYDPACGSGTFLIETLKYRRHNQDSGDLRNSLWGTDKNPRMLLLAELNIGHFEDITFHRRVVDALFPTLNGVQAWPTPNSFDVILTNPPFGVYLDNTTYDLRAFRTCIAKGGHLVSRQHSEIVFIEQLLAYLKPGGILGIILPKSVVTNSTLATARKALDQLGYIYAIVTLPPETFALTGTQVSTVVLFVHKYRPDEPRTDAISVAVANVSNVGHDSTGRARADNELPSLANDLRRCLETCSPVGICELFRQVPRGATFSEIGRLLSGLGRAAGKVRLADVVEDVRVGSTSARSNYTSRGLLVIKVGNLTGTGIDWLPRERNFVGPAEMRRRAKNGTLMLREGDILLTAAAHSVVYIAKKVDIVDGIPDWLGSVASFSGEIMLIRPNSKIVDPFVLLAYLRAPQTTDHIQKLVRGQTAHLYPSDLLELPLPETILHPDEEMQTIAKLLRRETELNRERNDLAFKQQSALSRIDFGL